MQSIILIGFMGARKTTVGKRLAARLKWDFIDTDEYIEQKAGMAVSEIFDRYGEENFRARETEALREILQEQKAAVISVGGGLPMRKENREYLKEIGRTIYLRAQVDTLVGRLSGDTGRPLLRGQDLRTRIQQLMELRSAVYESAADVILDTDTMHVGRIVREIAEITEDLRDAEKNS